MNLPKVLHIDMPAVSTPMGLNICQCLCSVFREHDSAHIVLDTCCQSLLLNSVLTQP